MIVAVRPDARHGIPNFFRRRPAAEHRTDVVAPVGKKAKKQSPFHRESGTGAVTAKRLRHGTDEADFTRAVQIVPALRHFPAVQRLRRRNGPHLINPAHDFRRRHHVIHSPTVGGARVHVFNETERNPGAAERFRQGKNFLFVHAAFHNRIHFDGKPRFAGCANSLEHLIGREPHVVDGLKEVFGQCIETHRHAIQSGRLQRLRLTSQNGGVRRHRNFQGFSRRRFKRL